MSVNLNKKKIEPISLKVTEHQKRMMEWMELAHKEIPLMLSVPKGYGKTNTNNSI